MNHNPEAILFAWIFMALAVVLAIVIIKNVKDMKMKHNLSDAHCNHSDLDDK